MSEQSAKRPWLAALLAVVYPGLGHAYLWKWGRAVFWSGTAAFVGVVLIDAPLFSVFGEGGLRAVGAALSPPARVAIVAVKCGEVADAYRQARLDPTPHDRACPECGRDVDDDLAFCHWCTTALEPVEE